jgi:2-polyprenyl-3-methyl-5-hydroxy-6-metoxy-1,4-benzoquinol methylase
MPGLIERGCPVCGGRQARSHWRKEDVTLVDCEACGMVFANPIPAAMASGEHYEGLAQGLYLSPDKLAADYAPVRFERELKLFREFCRQGRVLDVGCSTGAFLFQLGARWPGVYARLGMDVVGPALDHAEGRGVPVRRGAFLEDDFGDGSFDAVTLWAVVEHLVEPSKFLAKVSGLLRQGGHCFVLVPNLNSFAMRLLGPRYRYVMAEHVNYFTAHTLRALVSRIPGLEVVALRSTHFNPVVIWQDWRGRGRRVPDAERVAVLKRTTAWKQRGGLARGCHRAAETCLGVARLADNLVLVAKQGMVVQPTGSGIGKQQK